MYVYNILYPMSVYLQHIKCVSQACHYVPVCMRSPVCHVSSRPPELSVAPWFSQVSVHYVTSAWPRVSSPPFPLLGSRCVMGQPLPPHIISHSVTSSVISAGYRALKKDTVKMTKQRKHEIVCSILLKHQTNEEIIKISKTLEGPVCLME